MIELCDKTEGGVQIGFEYTGLALIVHRLKHWWHMNIIRRVPHLVWYGQDIDVQVKFTDLRLAPECTIENLRYEGDMETLWKAEAALHQLGLTFDAGTSHGGRDWEFDWSLRGPVKLSFRGKHKGDRKPKNQRPELKLVERTLSKGGES